MTRSENKIEMGTNALKDEVCHVRDFDDPVDAYQTWRLLSPAVIQEGVAATPWCLAVPGFRSFAIVFLRFNAEGPEVLIDRNPPGTSSKLNDNTRRAFR